MRGEIRGVVEIPYKNIKIFLDSEEGICFRSDELKSRGFVRELFNEFTC